MNYVIDAADIEEYRETGKMPTKLRVFWEDFVSQLPRNLQDEAKEKGFELFPKKQTKLTRPNYFYNVMFQIPDASDELKEALTEIFNVIVCMRDPV
jgi:hypothetical protein